MSGATFDTETLRLMNLFESITHAATKDCVVDADKNCIYFVVGEGEAGAAIGKNGNNVKRVEAVMKKDVKIFEFSRDLETFVRNLIPQANGVSVRNGEGGAVVEVRVDSASKAITIGRERRNVKLFKELLRRNHNVSDLIVR